MATALVRLPKKGIISILQFQASTTTSTISTKFRMLAGRGTRYASSSSATKGPEVGGTAVALQNSVEKVEGKRNLPNEVTFFHPQHDMYVCWHPEVPFPYEMSKPIPTEAAGTESSLKIQALEPVREVFRKKDERLIIREMMQLTYTPKHAWLGRHGKKIKYVRQKMDPLKQWHNRTYL